MFSLLIIGLFAAAFVIANSRPRTAAALSVSSSIVILIFRVLPGVAGVIDFMIMALFIITAVLLFMMSEWTEHKRTWRTYLRSFKATFSRIKY